MRHEYLVTLKRGKKIHIWFYGKVLEETLKEYNIPFEIIKKRGK